jgi:isoleucyl-tRNA synthetase
MRDGRFRKLLEGAPEWAISRTRYWGAPLPIWKNKDGSEIRVVGGVKELVELSNNRPRNTYYVVRHGEADSNAMGVLDAKGDPNNHLTEKGKEETRAAANALKDAHVDRIIVSPFIRAQETAAIFADLLGVKDVATDERLKETNVGIFDGRPLDEFLNQDGRVEFLRFSNRPEGGETHEEVQNRMMACLYDEERKNTGKTILIVTHGGPARVMLAGAKLATQEEVLSDEMREHTELYLKNGEIQKVELLLAPRDETGAVNLHRPYIDEVVMTDSKGGEMKRIPDVFDCWYESGSMPYAQFHYPFENKELFEKNFPANFIAEGVDQTRGWFSSLLVLSAGLFDVAPFEHVVVNGIILAEDGQKMSKKLKNYPDPWDILNQYGADATRYYLLSSPVVHSEDLAFAPRGVDEVVKKFIMRLGNVLSFYELYPGTGDTEIQSTNILDLWILARLKEVLNEETAALDMYELDRAVKPLSLFVDDLSTWYLRRSRDRFKSDDTKDRQEAITTIRFVLLEFSKILAPVMPFLAEHLYERVHGEKESVHLDAWPQADGQLSEQEKTVLLEMAEIRRVVSLALEARAKAGIKIRQPLARLTTKSAALKEQNGYTSLVIDEVNVKEVSFDEKLADDVILDTAITPELKKEGQFRDLLRTVQEARKTKGLMPSDIVALRMKTNDEGRALIDAFADELKKTALIREVSFLDVQGEPITIDGIPFVFELEK